MKWTLFSTHKPWIHPTSDYRRWLAVGKLTSIAGYSADVLNTMGVLVRNNPVMGSGSLAPPDLPRDRRSPSDPATYPVSDLIEIRMDVNPDDFDWVCTKK